MSEGVFPFRRMTQALLVPVGVANASAYTVPDGMIKPDYTAFLVFNPNNCCVELRGTSMPIPTGPAPTQAVLASGDGIDWLFPPGHWSVYTTQYPMFMSAKAFDTPAFPLSAAGTTIPLRLWYGYGA